jgi:hypothetical protein
MSSLTPKEKAKLEKLFGMSSGYVAFFNNADFGNFFAEEVDIHWPTYCSAGTSKANKLRQFWKIENDFLVGRALAALMRYFEENQKDLASRRLEDIDPETKKQIEECRQIAARLLSGQVNLQHLKEAAPLVDAKHLSEQIRRAEQSVESDPALAIGTAKELIQTCCKTILAERGKPVTGLA